MPNKYYLREDRKAVKPTQTFGRADHWNTESEKEHNDTYEAFMDYIASLPALDVDPDYLKRLSTGWFEGEERYEQECWDKWEEISKKEFDNTPYNKRLTIVAPQEASKHPEWDKTMNSIKELIDENITPQPVAGEEDPFIKKHLDIIWRKLREAKIEGHIKPMFGGLESASIEHFLKTGTISGSFHNRLMEMMDGFRSRVEVDQQAASRPSDAVARSGVAGKT